MMAHPFKFLTLSAFKIENMKLLEGKVALVTGASRGIGKAIAKTFVDHGATVCFSYASSDEKARALEAELSEAGGTAKGFKSNAADFNAAQELVDENDGRAVG